MGIDTDEGVYQHYNGIDVVQTRHYIKVGCESYIDHRMLLSHSWDKPSHKDPHNLVPISQDVANRLMSLEDLKRKRPMPTCSLEHMGSPIVLSWVNCNKRWTAIRLCV